MKIQASNRLRAYTIDQKLQRLHERRTGKPYSGGDYVSPIDHESERLTAGRETSFGGGVLFYAKDTGRFLLLKRGPDGDEPGTWCVPGGGVEPDETIDQGVRREVREEVGYDEPYDLVHMYRDPQDGFTFHNHFATLDHEFEPRLNHEHTAAQWCDEFPQPMHPRLSLAIEHWLQQQQEAARNESD